MVHALREIARVLEPDGALIEFRPLGTHWPLEIIAGDQIQHIGLVERAAHIRDDAACEEALTEVIHAGYFLWERQQTFALYETVAAPNELTGPMVVPDAVAEEAQRRLVEAGGEGEARVRIRYHNTLARYRKPSYGVDVSGRG